MQKKNEYDTYQSNLRFDNLNFKLAVLQHLIFEKKVFSPEYDFGDFEQIYYDEELSSEECEEAIEQYIQKALHYFTYLKVPADLAKHVTELQIASDNDIYFEINPECSGEEGLFDIDKISDREISQFPKLRRISFWYMSNNVEGLRKQLKAHKIKVELSAKESRNGSGKVIPPLAAILCLLIVTMGVGGVAGKIFSNRYQDNEVTWSTSPVETDEKSEPEETRQSEERLQLEEENAQSEYDFDKAFEESYEESQKKLEKTYNEVMENLKQGTEEEANE